MSDVGFDYVANPPPGSGAYITNLQKIMDAWSGGVYADDLRKLFINGGGHNDYDGNEWYAFDLFGNLWERINDPTLELEEDAVNGIFTDGAPIPIHSYGILGYHDGKVYRLGRSGSVLDNCWSFDLSSKAWAELASTTATDDHSGSAFWNPTTTRFHLVWKTGGGFADPKTFNPSTGVLTPVTLTGDSPTKAGAAAFSVTRQEIVWRTTTTDYGRWGFAGDVGEQITTTGLPALSANHGFTYDSQRGLYVAWEGGSTLHYLDPADWSWTSETPGGATPDADTGNGTFGRFQYVSEYDVLIGVQSVSGNVYLSKPEDWSL